jgi:signal transduction histidine kinase
MALADKTHDTRFGTSTESIEQRSAAELSARAAQRLSVLAEMTGGIAHDFRNILAVIDSGLHLAQKSAHDPAAASALITGAREGVARGVALTSQLLSFAKQRELIARAGDANELLTRLDLFLRYAAGAEVRIILELSSDIPDCLIDPSQFNAAILNLVINARDAMANGGEVRISTARWVPEDAASEAHPGEYVRVRVKDEGVGMTDDVIQNIFQPFFTTKGEHGTGLGLPQVVAFMRNVGGHVGVVSALGRGTTFDLFFPAVAKDPHHLPALAGRPLSQSSMAASLSL